MHTPRYTLKYFQSAEDFAANILDDLYLNITTINLLKPGQLTGSDISSDVMSYAIMRDSLGIVHDAQVEVKRKGDSLSGALLGKTLKRVSDPRTIKVTDFEEIFSFTPILLCSTSW